MCIGVALAVVLIDKYHPMGVAAWVYLVLAGAVGVLLAAGIALARGRGPIDAAIEIDRRFGLKERVSSTLALTAAERETEIGQALIADAKRRIKKIEIADQFRVAPGGQILLPLIPLRNKTLQLPLASSWETPRLTRPNASDGVPWQQLGPLLAPTLQAWSRSEQMRSQEVIS